jgi:putative nucleotidyltransferase with HDIG domain
MVYSPFLFSTRKLAGTGVIHQLSAFYFYFSAAHAASFNHENYFVTGVLHDIGKLVFFEFSEDQFAAALALSKKTQQSLQAAEMTVFGIDHSETGALLAERWRFPSSIVQAIRHHQTGIVPGKTDELTAVIHLGNIFCRALELGYPGDDFIPQPNPYALDIINAQPDLLKEITPSLMTNYKETTQFLL